MSEEYDDPGGNGLEDDGPLGDDHLYELALQSIADERGYSLGLRIGEPLAWLETSAGHGGPFGAVAAGWEGELERCFPRAPYLTDEARGGYGPRGRRPSMLLLVGGWAWSGPDERRAAFKRAFPDYVRADGTLRPTMRPAALSHAHQLRDEVEGAVRGLQGLISKVRSVLAVWVVERLRDEGDERLVAELGGDMRALWESMWRPFLIFDGRAGAAAAAEGGSVAEGEGCPRPEGAEPRGGIAPETFFRGVLHDLGRLLALYGEGRGWRGASRASGAPLPPAFWARSAGSGVAAYYGDYVRLREEASRKELRRKLLEKLLSDVQAPVDDASKAARSSQEIEKRWEFEGALIRVVLSHDGDDADPIESLTFSFDEAGDFVPKPKWVSAKGGPTLTDILREVEAVLPRYPSDTDGGSAYTYLYRQTKQSRGGMLDLGGEFTSVLAVWLPRVKGLAGSWKQRARLKAE